MKPGRQKRKGGKYEGKVAKQLSEWIFGEPNILWRESTSGGRKVVYKGDVVPVNAHQFPWSVWPFLIETKDGYANQIPTLMRQTIVREWLTKLVTELDNNQFIPILIVNFKGSRDPILVTNQLLNCYCDTAIIHTVNSFNYWFYIYHFKEILKLNFYEILPDSLKEYILSSRRLDETRIPTKPTKKSRYDYIGNILGEIIQ